MTNCRVIDLGVIPYGEALALQRREVERVQRGGREALYLLEHPPVITAGRNADGSAVVAERSLIAARGVELVETDRGGDVTYHGPGQLVGYPIVALEPGRRDIRRYVHDLEEVLIRTLADFGVRGARHPEHRGVWAGARKIASLGIRVSRWVTSHGFALNVSTDLSSFSLIHPCGIAGCEMTTIARETGTSDMAAVKESAAAHFGEVFGRSMSEPASPDSAAAEGACHVG